jgi:hypothetical protein
MPLITSDRSLRVVFSSRLTITPAMLDGSHRLRLVQADGGTFTVHGLTACPLTTTPSCAGLSTAHTDVVLASPPAALQITADGGQGAGADTVLTPRTAQLNLTLKDAALTAQGGATAAPLALTGGANLSLAIEGANTVTSAIRAIAGIAVPAGNSLTIPGADPFDTGTAAGTLVVTAGQTAAGIGGGGGQDAGTIQILGGAVSATGGVSGAGIGGGHGGAGGDVTIGGRAVVLASAPPAPGTVQAQDVGTGAYYAGAFLPGTPGDSLRIDGGSLLLAHNTSVRPTGPAGQALYPLYAPPATGLGTALTVGRGAAAVSATTITTAQAQAFGAAWPSQVAAGMWVPAGAYTNVTAPGGPYQAIVTADYPAYEADGTANWLVTARSTGDAGTWPVNLAVTGGQGTIRPSGSVSAIGGAGTIRVRDGADETLTFIPADGYEIAAVTLDRQPQELSATLTLHDVGQAHQVGVTFTPAASGSGATWAIRPTDLTAARHITATITSDTTYSIAGLRACPAAGCTGNRLASDAIELPATLDPSTILTIDGDSRTTRPNPLNVTLQGVALTAQAASPLQVTGGANVTLHLTGDSTLSTTAGAAMAAGAFVAAGAELHIVSDGAATGRLTATGAPGGAGIGTGPAADAGTVLVASGTVTATGGTGGAGIGAGPGHVAEVQSQGGAVTAAGGRDAPGIGGGTPPAQGATGVGGGTTGGQVAITGGTVKATGGASGAGIGGGRATTGGNVTITGGTVLATGGDAAAGIGGGAAAAAGTVALTGGSVVAAAGQGASDVGAGLGDQGAIPPGQPGNRVLDTGGSLYAATGTVQAPADPVGTALYPVYVPASADPDRDGRTVVFGKPAAGRLTTLNGAQAAFFGTAWPAGLAAVGWVPAASYSAATVGGGGGWTATVAAATSTAQDPGSANWLADDSVTVTASVDGGGGTISPAGTAQLRAGASAAYRLTPKTGYWVAGLDVDGETAAPADYESGTYTFPSLSAGHHAITATFATSGPDSVTLDDDAAPAGATITFAGDDTFSVTGGDGPATRATGDLGDGLALASDSVTLDAWTDGPLVIDGAEDAGATRPTPLRVVADSAQLASTATSPIELTGGANVELILRGDTTVTAAGSAAPAIAVPAGCRLLIRADTPPLPTAPADPGMGVIGSLTATGGTGAAGIGSGDTAAAGRIAITSGTVLATGGAGPTDLSGGAGIGGGAGQRGGSVLVGGTAQVVAAAGGAATCGVGSGTDCGTPVSGAAPVTITGGSLYTAGNRVEDPVDAGNHPVGPIYLPAALTGGLTVSGGTLPAGLSAQTATRDQVGLFGPALPAALSGVMWAPAGAYRHIRIESADGEAAATATTNPPAWDDPAKSTDDWLLTSDNTHLITASQTGDGQIDPSGATTLMTGAGQTYTITPAAGAQLQALTIDGQAAQAGDTHWTGQPGTAAASTYTFENTTRDHQIRATFAPAIDTLAVTNADVASGGALTVTFLDNDTYSLTGYEGACPASGCDALSVQDTPLMLSGAFDAEDRLVIDGGLGAGTAPGQARPNPIRLVLNDATLTAAEHSPIELTGGANLDLLTVQDPANPATGQSGSGTTVTASGLDLAAIAVPTGNTLTVTDQATATGLACGRSTTGACAYQNALLHVSGGPQAAGIGGGAGETGGTIRIAGGTTTTRGGENAAALGGGYGSSGGTITMTGGMLKAQGGDTGAGVGGGYGSPGGTITMTGGTLQATGGKAATGIGGGRTGAAGTITVSGTAFATTFSGDAAAGATPGAKAGHPDVGAGSGYPGDDPVGEPGNCLTIKGGSFYAADSTSVPASNRCATGGLSAGKATELYPMYVPADVDGSTITAASVQGSPAVATLTSAQEGFLDDSFPSHLLSAVLWAPAGTQTVTDGRRTYTAHVTTTPPHETDATASANWVITKPVNLSVRSSGPGLVRADGLPVDLDAPYPVRHGATQAFLFSPAAGARIAQITVDGRDVTPETPHATGSTAQAADGGLGAPGAGNGPSAVVGQDGQVTLTNIAGPHTIAVVFEQASRTFYITTGSGPGGRVTPAGRIAVLQGGQQTVTIQAQAGYAIRQVLVDGAPQGPVGSWTFGSVTADHTLTATFTQVVTKVKAAQGTLRLVKGKSAKVAARGYGLNAKAVKLTWASSKKKVAGVTSYGKIKGVRPGKAVVTVSAAGLKAKILVTVVKKAPPKAKNKVRRVAAHVGKTLGLGQVRFITATWGPKTATGVTVSYRSTKSKVASVDKAGRIVAKHKGTTTIRVKAGAATKKYKLTVK